MKKQYLAIVVVLIAGIVFWAGLTRTNLKGHNVLVHVVTNIKKDDGPLCVAFDIAYADVMSGNHVELLFDSEAAWNLKKTDVDLKQLLSSQFNDIELLGMKDFGGFLELLSKRGAVISVNGTWNVLASVEKELKGNTKMPSFVNPLTLKEMVEHLNNAERYYTGVEGMASCPFHLNRMALLKT